MTGYKLKSFADLGAWSDELIEERLQDAARLLSRHGATDEQIAKQIDHLRAELNAVRAEYVKGSNDRAGAPLQ